ASGHKRRAGAVRRLGDTSPVSNAELLGRQGDVLLPGALEHQLTAENAARVRAKLVVEAANGPTTPGADAILERRGVTVIPDILANAGGVIVSYFERVQDLQSLFWEETEINKRLEAVMTQAFGETCAEADEL